MKMKSWINYCDYSLKSEFTSDGSIMYILMNNSNISILHVLLFWRVAFNFLKILWCDCSFTQMKLSNAHEETLKAVLEMFMYLERLQTLKSLQNMHDSYLKSFSGLIFTDTRPTFDSFIQTESNKFCVILHTVNSILMTGFKQFPHHGNHRALISTIAQESPIIYAC